MISSLNIKGVATFDDANGVQIDDLKKVNYFFGFNGSGKSTIVKYLRSISLDDEDQNQIFSQCTNVGYDDSQHQMLVYNEDFIEENFIRSDEFKGVFSLNQSNASIDQQISEEESKILGYESLSNKYDEAINLYENDKRVKTSSLLDYCWEQRSTFATFTKINLAHSGSKPNHLSELRRVLQGSQEQVLDISELSGQYQLLYEKDLVEITQKVDRGIYKDIRKLEAELQELLQEVIVGNEDVDISGLIETLNSRTWVEQGIRFLDESNSICPFCQNETIDSQLRDQFDKLFDETYKEKISKLENLRESYKSKTALFETNISDIQTVFNPNNTVSDLLISLKSLFEENIKILNYKIGHSNERKTITSLSTKKDDLSVVTKQININNQNYLDSDANKEVLIKDIWMYMAGKCRQQIEHYDSRLIKYTRITTLANDLKTIYSGKIATSRQNLETLRGQTVNTKDAVDNINTILQNAGFEGFEIDEKEVINNISRYYLKRQHTSNTDPVFRTLSEGEKNFIAFLYFYQLCIGTDNLQNNGTKKKIIVIDDPVSSLDSQALFVVSTLIHSLTERKANEPKSDKGLFKNTNIAQIFTFTHNIYFYKEVSFQRRPICTDYWHFKISKINNSSTIVGDYNKAISDDYSLMWDTLREIKINISQDSSQNIMVANLMRRIIESYVSFVGYGNDSWSSLLNEDQDDPTYYIKCAFISTINDESHRVTALDSAYYQRIITEQPQVLFSVFGSIFTSIGKEHYELMMAETL